jgi:hypothetical protein
MSASHYAHIRAARRSPIAVDIRHTSKSMICLARIRYDGGMQRSNDLSPEPSKLLPRFEPLEVRRLFALKTVDFADYQIRFDQLNFLMREVGPTVGGLGYTLGTGDGQRTARNGITWPDAAYYETTLGAGGFAALNTWSIRPAVVYTAVRNVDWVSGGWNLYQDMGEGAACVDDTARAATALMEDYLRNGTEASFQGARDALTFVSYMMSRDGRMYDFVFLDGPTYFNWDPIQSQNKHYGYRAEYVKRTQYPPGTGDPSWINSYIDPAHIVGWPQPQDAPPFLPHQRYSIYMNDLRDANNNDVAATWQGPIFTSTGAPNGFQTDRLIKQTYTTSTQRFGFEEARSIEAYGKAMLMLAKRANANGGLSTDETYFARLIENHTNRLLRNLMRQTLSSYDSKLQSVLLAGLSDYYRAMFTVSPYGVYTPRLPADSGTAETTDDQLNSTQVMSMIDTLTGEIRGELFRTSDWRNGIFINNSAAGNWAAWGEFQIAALAKAYRLKRAIGQTGAAVEALLDDAVYAAENFYGKEGWHYSAPGTDNVRTKERTNYIQAWSAFYHTNSDQSGYYNSSIVIGLAELAEAYGGSGRPDAAAKRDLYLDYMKTAATWWIGNNNTRLDVYDGQGPVAGTTRGRGANFDGIAHGNGDPFFNRNSGAESNVEGLRTIIVTKDLLARYGRPTSYTFEAGPNPLPAGDAPFVIGTSFDVNERAVRFAFNEDVGAAVDMTDVTIVCTDPGGSEVSRSLLTIAYDTAARQLSYGLPHPLPDGHYRATLRGVGIVDTQSNLMLADRTFDFFVLAGDANRDGRVDLSDFNILAANFGQSNRTFTQGDFNYDGTVNLADFNILASKFGVALSPHIVGTGSTIRRDEPAENVLPID